MTAVFSYRHPQASRLVATGSQFRRRLELRKQAGGYPMTLITTLAVGALAGMMLAPANGSALARLDPPGNVADGARTTAKTARLPRAAIALPAKARPQAAEAPNACMPAPATPRHRQPIAYV